jgi:hypothetical protein
MPVYKRCCTGQLVVLAYGSQQLSWNTRTRSNLFRIAGYVIVDELQERLRVLACFQEVGVEADVHIYAQAGQGDFTDLDTRLAGPCTQGCPVSHP